MCNSEASFYETRRQPRQRIIRLDIPRRRINRENAISSRKAPAVIIIVLACLWLAAPLATAGTIDLGKFTKKDIDSGLGFWNSDEKTELTVLNEFAIPTYNETFNPDLPLAGDHTNNIPASGKKNTIDVSGWNYIMLKYATTFQYYYIEPGASSSTFITPKDLSHYLLFSFEKSNTPSSAETSVDPSSAGTSVPDGGSTLLLLSAALLALSVAYRKL
jgi:hypothetical protein